MSVALQMKTAIIDPVNCNLKGAYFIIFLLANKHQLTHTQFACFKLNTSMSPILSMQNTHMWQMNACQSLSIMCVYVWLSNRRHAFVSYLRQKHSSIAASVTLTSSGNHSTYMMWRSRLLFQVSSHIFGDCCLMLVARTTGVTGRGSIAPW